MSSKSQCRWSATPAYRTCKRHHRNHQRRPKAAHRQKAKNTWSKTSYSKLITVSRRSAIARLRNFHFSYLPQCHWRTAIKIPNHHPIHHRKAVVDISTIEGRTDSRRKTFIFAIHKLKCKQNLMEWNIFKILWAARDGRKKNSILRWTFSIRNFSLNLFLSETPTFLSDGNFMLIGIKVFVLSFLLK